MFSTPWQRAWLQVTNPEDCPFEAYDSLWTQLRGFGFNGIHLGNVHHGTRVDWNSKYDAFLAAGRKRGWIFSLMGWLNEESPQEQARTAAKILAKTGVPRYIANAEDPFQASEFEDGGRSAMFLTELRKSGFSGQIGVSTYPGVDLDWGVWRGENARLYVQTYNNERLRSFPADVATAWAISHGWQRSRVKPTLPCYKSSDTQTYPDGRVDPAKLINDCQRARTVGFSLYYVNGALDAIPDWFRPFRPVIGTTTDCIAR